MKRGWIISGILFAWLGLAILLVFGLRESMRQVLAGPLAYISGVLQLLDEIVPQPICWAVLLFIGLGWFMRSMSGRARSSQSSEDESFRFPKRERVDFWLLQIRHAQDINSRGRFADFMNRLISEVVAYQTRQPPQFSERIHGREQLPIPDDIRKILNTWRSQSFQQRKGVISNILNRSFFQSKSSEYVTTTSFERELDAVVSYLEEQLEIKT